MELWELYDIDRAPTGETMARGGKCPQGRYHNVIHICLFNKAGEMLIQQRQPFKDGWSNMWDITLGGSKVAGENSREGAARELGEELGIKYDFTGLRPAFTINVNFIFDDFYIIDMEVDASKLRLQPEEVKTARWASRAEMLDMIDAGVFIPYHKSLIDFIFDFHSNGQMRSRRDDSVPTKV